MVLSQNQFTLVFFGCVYEMWKVNYNNSNNCQDDIDVLKRESDVRIINCRKANSCARDTSFLLY